MCLTLNGVREGESGLRFSQWEWMRWLCATFTKSRSCPFGSGIVRWGMGRNLLVLVGFLRWGSIRVEN